MNLDFFLNKKKGVSYCPSDVGKQWTTNEIREKLPEFYRDNEPGILRNYIHIWAYEQSQILVIIDCNYKTAFFQEYGS